MGFTSFERKYLEFLRRRFSVYHPSLDDPILDDPVIRDGIRTFGYQEIAKEFPELTYNRRYA